MKRVLFALGLISALSVPIAANAQQRPVSSFTVNYRGHAITCTDYGVGVPYQSFLGQRGLRVSNRRSGTVSQDLDRVSGRSHFMIGSCRSNSLNLNFNLIQNNFGRDFIVDAN